MAKKCLTIKRISFPEWAKDDQFFERLIDGDKMAIAIYRKQRSMVSNSVDVDVADNLRT